MTDGTDQRSWVIDTSSIAQVRRCGIPAPQQVRVFVALGALVDQGLLVYPREVLDELERGCQDREPDARYLWAKEYSAKACPKGTDLAGVKRVLQRVVDLIDHERVTGAEEADPYVVALALQLVGAGTAVTVVTEDRKDKPGHMSLATACGLWGVPSVPLLAFLAHTGIWKQP